MRHLYFFFYNYGILNRTKGLAVLFIFIALLSSGQNEKWAGGKISGKIIDSLSGQPIEYASVSLFNQSDNKVVNGSTSDIKGIFKLANISEGNYKILIDFIGYKRTEKKNITVSRNNQNIVLGNIKLPVKHNTIKEVTVTADKILIENKIDKMVYNAGNDITSQGGVAADILKKVPQVSVDVDGNVELQGNSNIRFLINGKPSVLFGNNIADVLQSIPSSQIQTIEIITSPGVKYDAEGTGGIINIILKKSNARGINGNISLSGGTRLENGSFNLNLRKGKFGANAFFSGNAQLLSTTVNKSERISSDTTTSSRLLQTGRSRFSRNGYQSGIGFDWDLTPKDIITGNFAYDYFGNNNNGSADRQTLLKDAAGNMLSDVNDGISTENIFHEHSMDVDLSYKKKFDKEDQELEIMFNSSSGNEYSHYEEIQKHLSPNVIYSNSYGNNPGIENETNITVDYAQPLGEDAMIETGAKAELDHINSKSDVYFLNTTSGINEIDATQTSSIDFYRVIYAGYLSATFKLFDFIDIKTGFRNEYTQANADYSNSGIIHLKPYNTVVPSMVISHSFKNRQILKISYSYRIERPDYGDMNPFINASDPKNISTGNPDLRPETTNKVELGYSQSFKQGANVNATLYYRGNVNDIQSYTKYYSAYQIGDSTYTNVAVSTRENIGHEDNFGLSLFASVPVTEKINIRTNISCYQRYINTGLPTGGNINGFCYRANVNASYQLTNTLIIELLGNFNSPRINAQGKMPSFTTYNFAFRKQLFNKKASIAITATNFLDKYVDQKTELTGQNFTISNTRQLPYRSFGFNFTYKFGKLEFKNEKEDEDINLTNPPGFDK
jgi:ferric enterobactin receptor